MRLEDPTSPTTSTEAVANELQRIHLTLPCVKTIKRLRGESNRVAFALGLLDSALETLSARLSEHGDELEELVYELQAQVISEHGSPTGVLLNFYASKRVGDEEAISRLAAFLNKNAGLNFVPSGKNGVAKLRAKWDESTIVQLL